MENSSLTSRDIPDVFNVTDVTEFNETETEEGSSLETYYPILATELALSIFCAISLIIIYVIIGEHKTLPGKNVITISCCLIVTYVLLIADLLMRSNIPRGICAAMGITVQTTFLATFFWTNVMSYDIMKTMSSVKPDAIRTGKYWTYSLYAWSMTLICVVPAVVLDHVDIPEEYKPKFGTQKCWLTGQEAYIIYFNTPVGLTLIANCIFFVMTARIIVKVRNATTILAANRHKKRFRLCIKLVLIMGLVWTTEFIPWITGIYSLYAAAGMLNCLHGVYLFLIFACKKRTFKQFFSSNICNGATHMPKKQKSSSLDTVITVAF